MKKIRIEVMLTEQEWKKLSELYSETDIKEIIKESGLSELRHTVLDELEQIERDKAQ